MATVYPINIKDYLLVFDTHCLTPSSYHSQKEFFLGHCEQEKKWNHSICVYVEVCKAGCAVLWLIDVSDTRNLVLHLAKRWWPQRLAYWLDCWNFM